MRFVLREKLFGIGDDLAITDDRGRQAFFVDGKLFSLVRRLEIKEPMTGEVLAVIRRRLVALLPTFDIRLPEGVKVTISKRISLLTDRLKINIPGADNLEIYGDFFHHEYAISQGGREIAHVSKRWVSLVDSYGVWVEDGAVEPLLILSSAVVIDELLDKRRDRARD